jgi:hypothetical protein
MGSQVRCNYAPGKVGRFPHDSSARQGGRISTRQRRPARWADFHTAAAPARWADFTRSGARQGGRISTQQRRPARWAIPTRRAGKEGRFHSTGARQGGPIPTRQQRPARWADFHTAPARGKVGRFPHGSGARQGGPIPHGSSRQDGRISQHRRPARWADSHTQRPGKVGRFPRQRRPARWADSHTAAAPGKMGGFTRQRRPARWADSHTTAAPGKMGGFPYRHVCSLCYPWIVQLSGSLVVWRSVPVTGRVWPLTRTAPRPEARRRGAHCAPRGGRTAAVWR